jgi:serine protease Do
MGYFDDQYPSRRSRRSRSIWTTILSSIIGGGVVMLMMPYLIEHGVIEIKLPETETSPETVQVMSPAPFSALFEEKKPPIDPNQVIVEAVNQVRPAVVGVINLKKGEKWFGPEVTSESGMGSGVIFEEAKGKAKVVTNYHVIAEASEVAIFLPSGGRKLAKVLGADETTDLAVLEIDSTDIEGVAPFGDSSTLQPGEAAIAIGNPLGLAFSQTVTVGVISSVDRAIPMDFNNDGQPDWELDVIQTDAAINPGNSGGALVNLDGKVIGINSLKIADTGVEGLGFAIPINDAKPIIEQLVQFGKVKRPFLGITPRDLSTLSDSDRTTVLKLPEQVKNGILLVDVQGPALKAGLERFDVIIQLDDKPISNSAQLRKYLYREKKIGDPLMVHFYRKETLITATVYLTEMVKEPGTQ